MVQASMTVPPQPFGTVATCQGIMLGASSPPTILFPPMKEGIEAVMIEVHDDIDLDVSYVSLVIIYLPQLPEGGGGDGDGGLGLGLGGAGVGAAVVVGALGSKHAQTEHNWVLTLSPQQSPPSHPQASLLLSSSQ